VDLFLRGQQGSPRMPQLPITLRCSFEGRRTPYGTATAVLTRAHLRAVSFQDNEFVRAQPPKALLGLPDFGGGIVSEAYAGAEVRVTTLERTLVDVLDAPDLGGGWEEIWRSLEMVEYFELDAVVAYALALGSALTTARLGFFLEQHRDRLFVEDRHLAPLQDNAPKQPRYLMCSPYQAGTVQVATRSSLLTPMRIP